MLNFQDANGVNATEPKKQIDMDLADCFESLKYFSHSHCRWRVGLRAFGRKSVRNHFGGLSRLP